MPYVDHHRNAGKVPISHHESVFCSLVTQMEHSIAYTVDSTHLEVKHSKPPSFQGGVN